mmetsp:Transcript_38757/g.75678  ORF Transcript_38757/g.75678 Transcript_38757/m.75678 type:complete len:194 (+) Transcript_38757:169-750(+)
MHVVKNGFSFLNVVREHRYYRDKDVVSWKWCGVSGTRTEYEAWGPCVLGGGGGRRYCGNRAGATAIFFGAGEEGGGIHCATSLCGTSFGGDSSCGERVAAGNNICVQGDLYMEVLDLELGDAREVFGEGKKPSARTQREDGEKSAFTTVFDNGLDVPGGGGRRYCGESVGAVVCIFGVDGRVGDGVVTEVGYK